MFGRGKRNGPMLHGWLFLPQMFLLFVLLSLQYSFGRYPKVGFLRFRSLKFTKGRKRRYGSKVTCTHARAHINKSAVTHTNIQESVVARSSDHAVSSRNTTLVPGYCRIKSTLQSRLSNAIFFYVVFIIFFYAIFINAFLTLSFRLSTFDFSSLFLLIPFFPQRLCLARLREANPCRCILLCSFFPHNTHTHTHTRQ